MRKGFGFHDRHSPFRFNPATLFNGGAVNGAFYDPSNITTLFQDEAGTTPVTAVEQTVGRILDLSGNGNHATQSVAGSRLTWSARVNVLTKTEQFQDAAWSRINANITPDATTAPNGTTTADLFIPTVSGALLFQGTTKVGAAIAYTFSFYAKAGGLSSIRTYVFGTTNANRGDATFNLSNGTTSNVISVGAFSNTSATITNAGDGWYRCTITTTTDATTGITANLRFDGTVNGVNGVFVWAADLRPANTSALIPIYQRVNTSTDYDTNGFPLYLALDGGNDSMLTGSIDFTGTDKMTVWAGVTKSSDAAQGVVAELSATIASNNGAFLLSAPNSAAANYNWSSKGTTQVDNTVTTYTAPNTAVITGQADIAAPSNIIRVNGVQAGSVATTQGTGNFGNYALNIGRRNNATLPFNGRLYGLIVLGAAASDWQIAAAERWMAQKTGLQF